MTRDESLKISNFVPPVWELISEQFDGPGWGNLTL